MSRWDPVTPRVLAACGAFLLAVLWMDLMFDVQVLGGDPSASALASIRAYYQRVTVDSGAMAYLIGLVMLTGVGLAIVQARRSRAGLALRIAAPALVIIPVGLALGLIFPSAQELAHTDAVARQTELAQRICYSHLAVFAMISAFLGIQLTRRV